MATITFSTTEPLGLEAAASLPGGARVDNGPDGGRVSISLDADGLEASLQQVVAVARALPHATLSVDGALAAAAAPTAATPSPSPPGAPSPAPASTGDDPWELVATGRLDAARSAFAGTSLDSEGRDRVRELARSTDPEEVALACDIAGSTDWRSFVSSMKRMLNHADTRVRVAAARAIGQLAGPAMVWQLQKLSGDSSPEVQEAVAKAVAAIEERSG